MHNVPTVLKDRGRIMQLLPYDLEGIGRGDNKKA